MASSRPSTATRPKTPLSPRMDTSVRYDNLMPPSPRTMQVRPSNGSRRPNSHSLRLPSLPRFHPANYPSSRNSLQTTPDATNTGSPQAPLSPRSHQRMMSDAQKVLYAYQRDHIWNARVSSPGGHMDKPETPKLAPAGSPGPMTPFELEGQDGYLLAGVRSCSEGDVPPAELINHFIREERARSFSAATTQSGHGNR